MSRIRTIQPQFPRSTSMTRVSRDARLLFIQLWLVADDAGRLRLDVHELADGLYPSDSDAPMCLTAWLDELDRQGCIERYRIDGVDYLRVMHWDRHQKIYHPTPSCWPPSPKEHPSNSGIREDSGKTRGRMHKMPQNQGPADRSCTFPENPRFSAEDEGPIFVTRQEILRDIRRVQRAAEEDRSHPNALRSIAMKAEYIEPSARDEDSAEPRSASPAEIYGLPRTAKAID